MQNLSQDISHLNKWDVAASKWYGNLSSSVRAVKGAISLPVLTIISPIALLVAPKWEQHALKVAGEDLFKGVLGTVPLISQLGFRALNNSTATSRFEEHISEMTLLNIHDEIAKIKGQKTSTSQDKIYLKLLETKLSNSKAEITAKAEPFTLEKLHGVISKFEKEPNLTDDESFELSVFKDVFETKFGAEKKAYQDHMKAIVTKMSGEQIFNDIQTTSGIDPKTVEDYWLISILKEVFRQKTGLFYDSINFRDYPNYVSLAKQENTYKARIKDVIKNQTIDTLVADMQELQKISRPDQDDVWILQVLQEEYRPRYKKLLKNWTISDLCEKIQLTQKTLVSSSDDIIAILILETCQEELAERFSHRAAFAKTFISAGKSDLTNYKNYLESSASEELPEWKKSIELEEIDRLLSHVKQRDDYREEFKNFLFNLPIPELIQEGSADDSLNDLLEYVDASASGRTEWQKKIEREEIIQALIGEVFLLEGKPLLTKSEYWINDPAYAEVCKKILRERAPEMEALDLYNLLTVINAPAMKAIVSGEIASRKLPESLIELYDEMNESSKKLNDDDMLEKYGPQAYDQWQRMLGLLESSEGEV